MDFLRRLLGQPTRQPGTPPRHTPPKTGQLGAAAEISPPGAPISAATPMPIIEAGAPVMSDDTPVPGAATQPLANLGATRQLPPLEAFGIAQGRHIAYGLSSDVGMVRTNNQDALLAMFTSQISAEGAPDFGLFVVADGMGGHQDGERASAIATRVVARYVMREFFLRLMDTDEEGEKPVIGEMLTLALQRANQAVVEEISEGGTTVTAAVIIGDLAYIAHVGDSRAYLLSGDGLEQITRDHSLVQRLIELGRLTPDEAAVHTQRNVLYKAVGQGEHIDVDITTRRLPAGARLVLCSDGLWNNVPEDKLVQTIMAARSPQEACDKLVGLANERGGNDNITVVIVQVPG
jgi:protein phosphatase